MELKNIGEKMISQNNRLTQCPLFVIQVDRDIAVGQDMEWDKKERNEYYEGDLCDSCMEVGDVPEECDDCPDEAFHFLKTIEEFDLRAGAFFTEEACEEHIKANDYHYKNPRSFAVSTWRNFEMQMVMNYLCLEAGHVPSHYQANVHLT